MMLIQNCGKGVAAWLLLQACLVVMLALLTGCGSSGGAPPAIKVGTDILVSAELNPNSSGRPSPLALAIYQLKSADDFRNKPFAAVFERSTEELGADLLHREQIFLQPGINQSLDAEFDVQTEYIGVVGAFSDLENSQWRAVIELPDKSLMGRVFKSKRLAISVAERSVSITMGG